VIDEQCPHRRASLALAPQRRLRCLYHGWKISVHGEVTGAPNHAGEQQSSVNTCA
jgi:phenylpropionate dioxygenase-like ring-hydroxylating dioxygenase large terminal subunit